MSNTTDKMLLDTIPKILDELKKLNQNVEKLNTIRYKNVKVNDFTSILRYWEHPVMGSDK